MLLVNEKVEHISYGFGTVTEHAGNKIFVQFTEGIGNKIFLYPDAFDKFLRAVNPIVESNVLEELHTKQEQEKIEHERLKREREAAELEEKMSKVTSTRKKATKTVREKSI